MKSVVTKAQEVKFPKLMQSSRTGTIVLFREPCVGTVVADPSSALPLGYYSDGWDKSLFTDFHGKIELSND